MYNEKKQKETITALTAELDVFRLAKNPTEEMQEKAFSTLCKVKELFSTIEPDKKYRFIGEVYSCSVLHGGYYSYLYCLIPAKCYLIKKDYWNCCDILRGLFEKEPICQPRVISGVQELLRDLNVQKEIFK